MILLDTNALLWLAFGDERLGSEAIERIGAESEIVYVSPVSIFEAGIKSRLGKLTVPGSLLQHAMNSGYDVLALGASEAEIAGSMQWGHKDPFDRLLVAQARWNHLPLMTSDRAILDFEPLAVDSRI